METILLTVLATAAAYAAVIVATRLAGLRSFAKISAFDAAGTFAIGSMLATTATRAVPLPVGITAVATLFVLQLGVAALRRSTSADRLIDNRPVLLMEDGRILEDNMRRADIATGDLRAQLRQANVTSMDEVLLVVLETTGDISVVTGEAETLASDHKDFLLEGVVR